MTIDMTTLATLTALCATATLLQAQVDKTVPAAAELSDANSSSAFPFGYHSMRMQQIWDGGLICNTQAALFSMTARINKNDAAGAGPFTAQNLRVSLGHTSMTPATMSTTFATNVTGPMTTVFQGNLNLPAQPATTAKVAPFNLPLFSMTAPFVYARANGDLLMEMVSDPPNGKSSYFVDAATSGGNLVQWGVSGRLASDNLSFHATSRANQAIPGGMIDVSTETTLATYPGALLLGITDKNLGGAPILPLDLTPFGAPGNFMYLAPLASAPHAFLATPIGFTSAVSVPVPNRLVLVGGRLYAQSYLIDPPSTPSGLVMTDAVEATIGLLGPMPMALIGNFDINQPTGSPQFGSDLGGVVVRLNGVFQ